MRHTLLLLLALAGTAEAGSPKPEHCPETSLIIAAGVNQNAIPSGRGRWSAYGPINFYQTQQKWIFSLNQIKADNKHEAIQIAQAALPALYFVTGPRETMNGYWACDYQTPQGYDGVAYSGLVPEASS